MLILSTMLHGIGVGNMLPGWSRRSASTSTQRSSQNSRDRGSHQTIGIVTDVGFRLRYHELKKLDPGT